MSESPVDLMRRAAEVLWTMRGSLLPLDISDLVHDYLIECAEAAERGSTPQGQYVADEVLALAEQRRVVICASLRQRDDIAAAAEDEWREGNWTFAPAVEPSVSAAEHDRIHRARIDQADEVIVIAKPDGTLGEAVTGEMEYAQAAGKLVRRISSPATAPGPEPTVTREQADVLVDIAMRLGSHGDTIAALYAEEDAGPIWSAAAALLDWQRTWAKDAAGITVQDGETDE